MTRAKLDSWEPEGRIVGAEQDGTPLRSPKHDHPLREDDHVSQVFYPSSGAAREKARG